MAFTSLDLFNVTDAISQWHCCFTIFNHLFLLMYNSVICFNLYVKMLETRFIRNISDAYCRIFIRKIKYSGAICQIVTNKNEVKSAFYLIFYDLLIERGF